MRMRACSERTIGFYFDFASPFAYLAQARLPQLARRYGAAIDYRPIDVRRAKLDAGNSAPSTRSIPAKAKFIRQDRLRWAAHYGLPMQDPKAFSAPRLNRGVFHAGTQNEAEAYVRTAFHRVWGLGGDPDSGGLLQAVALDMAWDAQRFLAFVDSPAAMRAYEDTRRDARERGVFGVPMMILGEELFWGNDRLDFLEEALAARTVAHCGRD